MFAAKVPPTRLSLAMIRAVGYELTGRGLTRCAPPHKCTSATFSRPSCPAVSRLFASVPRCSVSKSVATTPRGSFTGNHSCHCLAGWGARPGGFRTGRAAGTTSTPMTWLRVSLRFQHRAHPVITRLPDGGWSRSLVSRAG